MHGRFHGSAGVSTPLVVTIILVILGIAGGTYYMATKPGSEVSLNPESPSVTPVVSTQPRAIAQTPIASSSAEPVGTTPVFTGTVLAGNQAKLLDFTVADYEAAKKTDKLIVLYYYADWCPICRAEFPLMQAAFDGLTTDKVIGFRVNFNDTETEQAEKDLAREHGVAYQHTKVFVKNGQRVLKSPEGWTQARYAAEIQTAL